MTRFIDYQLCIVAAVVIGGLMILGVLNGLLQADAEPSHVDNQMHFILCRDVPSACGGADVGGV